MRVYLPFTVLCAGLLAAFLVEANYDQGYEYGYGDNRAIQLQKTIGVVAQQKTALEGQLDMLQRQKRRLTRRLTRVSSSILPGFEQRQAELDRRLEEIAMELKEQMHSVDAVSSRVAGEKLVAERQQAMINPRWNEIRVLTDSNTRQAAQIAKINTTLIESMLILYDKLADARTIGTTNINEVIENTKSAVEYVNTRYCFGTTVVVEVLKNGTGVKAVEFPVGSFPDKVPTSYCVLSGFETHLDLGKSHSYGPEDELKGVGMKVNCKSFPREMVVTVFDNSKGDINAVKEAYVNIWACSFGPQSSYGPLDGAWR